MSTLVFLSGGVDSAVLAAAIAKEPYSFGLSPRNTSLCLFTQGGEKKRSQLQPLLTWLVASAYKGGFWSDVQVSFEESPLDDSPCDPMPEGGHATSYPLVAGYAPDRDSAPYTTGLHLWMASMATNKLAHTPLPQNGPRTAFWGFQEDNPYWQAKEAGKDLSCDASEDWLGALNRLMSTTPTKTRFRAPFLENRMDRVQIVKLGQRLKVPFGKTSSCMYAWDPKGCGVCHQCVRRAKVFKALEVTV